MMKILAKDKEETLNRVTKKNNKDCIVQMESLVIIVMHRLIGTGIWVDYRQSAKPKNLPSAPKMDRYWHRQSLCNRHWHQHFG